MNISTGGPHILLFERDQQFATLLTSEMQLAGYECHAARTAVEVFDAIARYSIRLVLVNLAQAATGRREFWVALDTQRRGRGVQVFTFRCANIAGYGPIDLDDRSQTVIADMEIDGMLGLMNLVDAVRTRVPGMSTNTNTGTMPRIPKLTPFSTPSGKMQQLAQAAPPATPTFSSGALPVPIMRPSDAQAAYRATLNNGSLPTSQPPIPAAAIPVSPPATPILAPTSPPASNSQANQPSYSEKIRAVLYPNQRNWSSPNTTSVPEQRLVQENRLQNASPSSVNTAAASPLQRLVNQQAGTEEVAESGLAQLTRMVQQHWMTPKDDKNARPLSQEEEATIKFGPSPTLSSSTSGTDITQVPVPRRSISRGSSRVQARQNVERNNAQSLRVSPMQQDMPAQYSGNVRQTAETSRRSEGLSQTNYGQQPSASLPTPMLSSISTPRLVPVPKPLQPDQEKQRVPDKRSEQVVVQTTAQLVDTGKENNNRSFIEYPPEERKLNQSAKQAVVNSPDNAILIDIMQSLPPMPPAAMQPPLAVQPQVLQGLATRSLGSVLLAGHLVPESRLEVAQQVQRMLRGVDLNYQLGEILLMFKLLTPDQLLAASLVSYGMITTTQISALGRIRQELHAIGLEYDLENLLIMFRILTPEQVREAKSSWQN